MICAELVRLGLSGYRILHSLVVTGKDPTPVELQSGTKIERADLATTHEEADVIMVQQTVELAESGAACITVVSDDTDVFILLIHFYAARNLSCKLFMETTGSDRAVIDIAATVYAQANIQGAPIKTIPYEKFVISVTVTDFFTKFTAFTAEDSRHICSKFHHNIYYLLFIIYSTI